MASSVGVVSVSGFALVTLSGVPASSAVGSVALSGSANVSPSGLQVSALVGTVTVSTALITDVDVFYLEGSYQSIVHADGSFNFRPTYNGSAKPHIPVVGSSQQIIELEASLMES